MNIAFIESVSGGAISTRATLTSLDRTGLEETLRGSSERLESFLYAPDVGIPWPCGPSREEWEYLCELALENPEARRALEDALAAVHHRAPVVLALKS